MVQRFLGSIVGLRHFLGVSDLADRHSRETSSKIAGESWISHQRQSSSYLVVGNQSSRHLHRLIKSKFCKAGTGNFPKSDACHFQGRTRSEELIMTPMTTTTSTMMVGTTITTWTLSMEVKSGPIRDRQQREGPRMGFQQRILQR